MSLPLRIAGLLACAGLSLCSCNSDVACIFTTGCGDGGDALASNPAALPVDGQWIVDGPPTVERFAPSGSTNPGTTPIVLVFSESLVAESVQGAFEITSDSNPQPVRAGEALVADGRVLVLLPLPTPPMPAGTYRVRLAEGAVVTDLTGQKLDKADGAEIGSFTVSSSPPAAPRLVISFPANGATDQSETGEIVVVLDRPVLPTTVNSDSFDVKVGGTDPTNDPPPTLAVPDGSSTGDPRVYLYRSVDGQGVADPLGTNAAVEVELSPASAPIAEQDTGVLAPTTIAFRTLAFAPARTAGLLSLPVDAIGIANLTDADPEELELEVELDDARSGDFVDLFLIGHKKSEDASPPLIALQRSLLLGGTGPIDVATFQRENIDLQFSADPLDTRFEDGPITFALRTRRGALVSPVRVLDLESDPDVIQDPLLDTVVPRVISLVRPGGSTSAFRTDQRGISLAGVGSERMRSADVTTGLGNTQAAVAGSTAAAFLTAPVPAGILATETTTYSLVARDFAANPSVAHSGTFTQLGAVGPGALVPGGTIDVDVFDLDTLAPVPAATVLVHSDHGDGATYPFFVAGTTGLDGRASVATEGAPSVAAIVTVVRSGFDLFTLHGVPATRLSVPLRRSASERAKATGIATTRDAAAIAVLPGMDRRFDDSRRPVELARGFRGQGPVDGAGSVSFAYGAEPIFEGGIGARSFYAGDFTQSEASFSATQLLLAFTLVDPFVPALAGQPQVGELEIATLLTDPGVPPADGAQALPPCVLSVNPGDGVDLARLDDDLTTTGVPFVSVETRVPGMGGVIAVAQGLAFDLGGNRWNVRAAQPGAITAGGSIGARGGVDTDPSLRMELRDVDGNVAGIRPRLSVLLAGGPAPEFAALPTAALQAPAPGANVGPGAFDLALRNAIGDGRAAGGLYRVVLEDVEGRSWTLWRVDPSGTADVPVRVVDVADGGALGFASGNLSATVAAFGWAAFSPAAFLWSDVEREFELFSFAAPTTLVKP